MAIPPGTKFAGIPPENTDINKKSKRLNNSAPLYEATDFPGGSSGAVMYVLKKVSVNTEGPEPVCTPENLRGDNSWLFTTADFSSYVGELVSLENNGVALAYDPNGEGEWRNCWYVELWNPQVIGVIDCGICADVVPPPGN